MGAAGGRSSWPATCARAIRRLARETQSLKQPIARAPCRSTTKAQLILASHLVGPKVDAKVLHHRGEKVDQRGHGLA